VSGHAGLFSNASDLGKYMQMHLQDGYYGGRNYFSKETIQKFTSRPEGSERRALGWDRPDVIVGNASKYASKKAFGHSGFTGTIVWADPEYELVYVFLSNRVYPDAGNNKLIQSNIRTRIHDIMYESFLNSKN
jgi:beta-N-acetylhexosaminidase